MTQNIEEVVAAADAIPPLPVKSDICGNCGNPISMAAFKGTGFCCVDCKKAGGMDVPSVGTMMFVTTDEREAIMRARNTPGGVLWVTTKKKGKRS